MSRLILTTHPIGQGLRASLGERIAGIRRRLAGLGAGEVGARGPGAVARSLATGLTQVGAEFELDPDRIERTQTLGVLSDLRALAQGIELRRRNTVDRLLAGPNLVVLPSHAEELMSAEEIDAIVVPSEWVKEVYEQDCPALAGRLAVWPAGVDADRWSPLLHQRKVRPHAFVFYKDRVLTNAPGPEAEVAAEQLRAHGFEVKTLLYGRFTQRAYLQVLRECELGVIVGSSESQGIAQVEAWSVGVPTLVRRCERFEIDGHVFRCSAAPYLSEATGAFFSDAQGLEALLAGWRDLVGMCDPRAWVLANMTNEICARAYLDLTGCQSPHGRGRALGHESHPDR